MADDLLDFTEWDIDGDGDGAVSHFRKYRGMENLVGVLCNVLSGLGRESTSHEVILCQEV